MENKIYENNNYKIILGQSEEDPTIHYLVINKEFGVVEAESRLYPQSIKYANDLDAAIVALKDIKDYEDTNNKVVTIKPRTH